MPNALQNVPPALPEGTILVQDNNGIIAERADVTNNNYSGLAEKQMEQILAAIKQSGFNNSHKPENNPVEIGNLNKQYYNLFVLEDEDYREGIFSIARSVALQKYTHDIDRFKVLSAEIINDIQNFPCLFTMRNEHYNRTSDSKVCIAGKLTEVSPRGSVIRFRFKYYAPGITQNIINENPQDFGIATASLRNELDVEHWAIKKIDLFNALSMHSIDIR